MRTASLFNRLRNRLHCLWRAEDGNVAIIFTIALIPIIALTGGAIDYSRASAVRTAMQAALDATALAMSKDASTLSAAALNEKATAYFLAAFNRPDAQSVTITASYSTSGGSSVTVTGSTSINTQFMGIVGINSIPISSYAKTAWGMSRLRVALALDNTGSMSSSGKMTALKTATKSLLTQLQTAATTPGDVYVSIVPFVKDVNAGKSNYNAAWIDWTEWDENNGKCKNYSSSWSEPDTKTKCLSKSGTWTADSHSTWNGCVMDRGDTAAPNVANYDINVSAPNPAIKASLFPAEQYGSCPQAVMGLNYDWTAMTTLVNNMSPNGMTNQGIGLAWAWLSLVGGGPFTVPAKDPDYQYTEVIILLSDGLNTENRWFSSSTPIDLRQSKTCDNAKAAKITIYSIQLNTGSDPVSSVLQNCASDSSKFFYLTSASQVSGVFNTIGTNLSKLRITN